MIVMSRSYYYLSIKTIQGTVGAGGEWGDMEEEEREYCSQHRIKWVWQILQKSASTHLLWCCQGSTVSRPTSPWIWAGAGRLPTGHCSKELLFFMITAIILYFFNASEIQYIYEIFTQPTTF